MKEIANRTKRHFIQTIVNQLIDKYILYFDELSSHMYQRFGICIVLEENNDYSDLIDGVYQIYEKSALIK